MNSGAAITISVVIPTYNRWHYVRAAIESVLAQSDPALEVIVVDDGSTDNTVAAIREAYTSDEVVVIEGQHRGASAARNLGVQHASGNYIAFLDSDDLFLEGKLRTVREFLALNPEAVFCHSYWIEVHEASGVHVEMKPTAQGDARHALLMFGQIATPTVVVRKSSFQQVGGFREQMSVVEDYDLWCRLSSLGLVGLISEPLVHVRIHDNNTPRSPRTVKRNQIMMIRHYFSHYPTSGLLDKKYYIANSLYSAAYLYFGVAEYDSALSNFSRAFRHDWKNNRTRCARMILRSIKALLLKQKAGFVRSIASARSGRR